MTEICFTATASGFHLEFLNKLCCSFSFVSTLPLKTVQVPVYSEQEYQVHLHDDGWTKAETDHLFDLCKRFDLRFIVVHDRYDHQQYRVIIYKFTGFCKYFSKLS